MTNSKDVHPEAVRNTRTPGSRQEPLTYVSILTR